LYTGGACDDGRDQNDARLNRRGGSQEIPAVHRSASAASEGQYCEKAGHDLDLADTGQRESEETTFPVMLATNT
jgi:hypothetical protein